MADAILPIVPEATPAQAWPMPHRGVGRSLLLTLPMALFTLLLITPVPEPNLKSMASLWARCMMDSMLSCTDWMKQALHCGYSYCVFARSARPVLGSQNQLPRLEELPM